MRMTEREPRQRKQCEQRHGRVKLSVFQELRLLGHLWGSAIKEGGLEGKQELCHRAFLRCVLYEADLDYVTNTQGNNEEF